MTIVHLLSWHELFTPLIRSQLFDRVSVQTQMGKKDSVHVQVWITFPLRQFFNYRIWAFRKVLQEENGELKLKYFFGIDRLNRFPAYQLQWLVRKFLKSSPVIFHSRGSGNLASAFRLRKHFCNDKVVYDVRGAEPLEAIARMGCFNVSDCNVQQMEVYSKSLTRFKEDLKLSDAVMTVSEPLKDYIIASSGIEDVSVSPCCVSNINFEFATKSTNTDENRISVLYLGGVQNYQHLEDLVLPFLSALVTVNTKVLPHLFTNDLVTMKKMIEKSSLRDKEYKLWSGNQREVNNHLKEMDLGLLLRAPTDLNSVAQPVKFAEYLASGLGVVVENGTGLVPEIVKEFNVGVSTNLYGADHSGFLREAEKTLLWFMNNRQGLRSRALKLVDVKYTWKTNVQKELRLYKSLVRSSG